MSNRRREVHALINQFERLFKRGFCMRVSDPSLRILRTSLSGDHDLPRSDHPDWAEAATGWLSNSTLRKWQLLEPGHHRKGIPWVHNGCLSQGEDEMNCALRITGETYRCKLLCSKCFQVHTCPDPAHKLLYWIDDPSWTITSSWSTIKQ